MAIVGWLFLCIICFLFTLKAVFWTVWINGFGGTRTDKIILLIAYCVLAFFWYKIFGWAPFEIKAT